MIFYSSLLAFNSGALAWMMVMPGTSYGGPLPALSPGEVETRDQLRADVGALAEDERNTVNAGTLDRSAEAIENNDRPATLDYDRLALVERGLEAVVRSLANGD